MIQKCKFDKKRDKGVVIKGLAPDINQMINDHKIPDTMGEVIYNQITEISNVGIRINDNFDTIMLARHLRATGLVANGGTGSSQPAGSTAPQASSNE